MRNAKVKKEAILYVSYRPKIVGRCFYWTGCRIALSRCAVSISAASDGHHGDFSPASGTALAQKTRDKGVRVVKFMDKRGWVAMRLDDQLLGGMFIGVTIGLHYAASLSSFMPIFMVLGLLYILRLVKAR